MCELNEVLFSYFILKTIKQTQKQLISMSVNSDEELMERREFVETAKARKGGDIDLYVSSAKPLDPNRPPKQCAKLGSQGNDEAQPNASEQAAKPTAAWDWQEGTSNTRVELPVPWDWQHRTAKPKESTEPVKKHPS